MVQTHEDMVSITLAMPANGKPAPAKRARGRTAAWPRARKARQMTRWSILRETTFLETLIQTANVAASIRASGLSETSVYRQRQKCGEFRAKWAAALREGYVRLETMLLDRAINGVEKTVWYGGKAVGTMTEYSDRLALALMATHRASVMGEAPVGGPSDAELRKQLEDKLSEMNLGMGGAG